MIPIVVNLDSNDWQLAQKQAAQIGKIKNADAKNGYPENRVEIK